MSRFIALSTLILCFLSACNNNRTQNLSRRGYCDPKNDISAFALTTIEEEVLKTTSLVEDDIFTAVDFRSTLVIESENEDKITLSLIGQRLTSSTYVISTSCLAGITPASKLIEPVSFEVPTSNKDGKFTITKITVQIGNPKEKDQSDFLSITSEDITPTEEGNTNDGDETEESKILPQAFVSFYSSKGDELNAYEFKESKDNLEPTYFLHHTNKVPNSKLIRVSTRLTLQKEPK